MSCKRALSTGSVAVIVLTCAAATLVVASTTATRAAPVAAQAPSEGRWHSDSERCMMRGINDYRAANGYPRLEWDRQLSFVARKHAESMAEAGLGIWHDPYLASRVTHWQALGENTGRGGGCKELFRAFVTSAEHRANMLGDWDFLGVGAGWGPGIGVYAEEVFASSSDPGNIWHYPAGS